MHRFLTPLLSSPCAVLGEHSSIGTKFQNKTGIVSFDELEMFTGVTTLSGSWISGSSLQRFKLPANLTATPYGLLNCSSLNMEKLVLPASVTTMGAFQGYGYTGWIELHSYMTVVPGYCYGRSIKGNGAYTFKILYNQSVLPITTSGSQGQYYNKHYYYVPDALLADYKAASGWSNIENRIFPLSEFPTT